MLWRTWADVPRTVRLVAQVEIVVLAYGGVVHAVQLIVDAPRPYTWAPAWLAVYFTSLTVADPLAALLLWARRTAGLYLGAAILVTDALANGYAIYGLSGGGTAARVSQAIVSLLAVAALVTAPRLRPWLGRRRAPGPRRPPE